MARADLQVFTCRDIVAGLCCSELEPMAAVQGDFLQALAGSRRQAAPAGPSSIPESLVVRRDSSAGRLRIDLSLACASTSLGVAQTLLTAFVEASSAAQRAWNGQMEITLPAAPASSGGAEQAAAAGAAPQPLIVQLTATSSDPEAEAAVEEAARLFEVRGVAWRGTGMQPGAAGGDGAPAGTTLPLSRHFQPHPTRRPTSSSTSRRPRATCTAACASAWARCASSCCSPGSTAEPH